jgi:hypothetical protein
LHCFGLGHGELVSIIYGTSAGGFLTGQAAMRFKLEGQPLPACLGIFTAGGDLGDLGDSARMFTLSGTYSP